jgi:transposase
MVKRKQFPSRQYTDEFKVEAVRLAESIGGNQAAKRLGIPDSSMWNWLRLSRAGKLKAMRGTSGQVKAQELGSSKRRTNGCAGSWLIPRWTLK